MVHHQGPYHRQLLKECLGDIVSLAEMDSRVTTVAPPLLQKILLQSSPHLRKTLSRYFSMASLKVGSSISVRFCFCAQGILVHFTPMLMCWQVLLLLCVFV